MSAIKKDANGKWRTQVFLGIDNNGKRVYKRVSGISKKVVEQKVAELRGAFTGRTTSARTVRDAVESYIDNRSNVLSPSTILQYREYAKNHLTSLADVQLSVVTQETVQRAINNESRHYSAKTVKNAWALVQSSLSAQGLPRFNVLLPTYRRKEICIPSNEDVRRIVEAVTDTDLEFPVLMACMCGLRRSEICALQEDDIDVDKAVVHVNKAVVLDEKNDVVEKATKTPSSVRDVEIPSFVLQRISNGMRMKKWKPNALSNAWERLTGRLGIDCRFHDLRHFYASTLLSLNVPDKYAMKRMGHSTNSTLKNVYQHVMRERDEEIRDEIEKHFVEIMQQ